MNGPVEIVVLWKAPQPGRDAAAELRLGFSDISYPGLGPYFTSDLSIALGFEAVYLNGLQEIRVPVAWLVQWLDEGMLQEDPYYPPGLSYHVPSTKLATFNACLVRLVTHYHPAGEIIHG